jgi:hypothetical protein
MYVIRRRPRDGKRIYSAEYLHRVDESGIFWVRATIVARRYATRAEAEAALEVLNNYLPDTYLLDNIPLEKDT